MNTAGIIISTIALVCSFLGIVINDKVGWRIYFASLLIINTVCLILDIVK